MPNSFRSSLLFVVRSGVLLALISLISATSYGQGHELTSTSAKEAPETNVLFSGDSPKTVDDLKFMQTHFEGLAKKAFPAVVNIQMGAAQGSGVVVTSDGYILTAAHVIAGNSKEARITFTLPDKSTKVVMAEKLGVENGIDSGMLKIKESEGNDFPYLDVGLSGELNDGQWVMAIGHPGGIDEARGLVVRIGRVILNSSRVIRTDCTLVGGDSGGPLIDMNGDVIGIHSRIGTELWQNLHVPIDTFAENWDQLAQGVILDGRPNLGFDVVDETNKVESVSEKGPADRAGLKEGDVILQLGGIKVDSKSSIESAKNKLNLRPNMNAKIVVKRGSKEQTLSMKIGQR